MNIDARFTNLLKRMIGMSTWRDIVNESHEETTLRDKIGKGWSLQEAESSQLIDLLSVCVFPQALRSLNDRWLASGKLDVAVNYIGRRELFFSHYEWVEVGHPIDWSLGQPGRDNLSWQLHSLNFLKDFALAYSSTGDNQYLEYVNDAILDWIDKNIGTDFPSKFSWNDHSSAFRLINLGHYFLFLVRKQIFDIGIIKAIIRIADKHQKVLLANDFYVRGTNHGLDQAYALFQSTLFFPVITNCDDVKSIAVDRLSFEVMKSFSEDGVHIENSPEYHDMILASSLLINDFVRQSEGMDIIANLDAFAGSALEYLAYVLRPDGVFPPIGDSLAIPPRNKFLHQQELEQHREFLWALTKGNEGVQPTKICKVFPTSGYAIFRSKKNLLPYVDSVHMVFKCGYLSHYHRQDDDNNVVLFAYAQEWLTDGGLYVHDHENPQRIHMRSHLAHNVSAPSGVEVIRAPCPIPCPGITAYHDEGDVFWVEGKTSMFKGFSYSRKLSYDGAFNIGIVDKIEKTGEAASQEFVQYWHIPIDKEVDIGGDNTIVIRGVDGRRLMMTCEAAGDFIVEKINSSGSDFFCYRSIKYGELIPQHVLKISFSTRESFEAKIDFRFECSQ